MSRQIGFWPDAWVLTGYFQLNQLSPEFTGNPLKPVPQLALIAQGLVASHKTSSVQSNTVSFLDGHLVTGPD